MKRVAIASLMLLLAAAPALAAPMLVAQVPRSERADEAFKEGQQRLENEDFEGAVGILQEAAEDAPDDEAIAKLLGQAQERAADKYMAQCLVFLGDKQYDEALNALDSATELAPKYAKIEKAKKALPYIRRGVDYLSKKDRAKATADFKKAYELWPDPAIKRMAEGAH